MTGRRADLRVVEPLGVFHAIVTRDAAARARDGQTFYAINNPPEGPGVVSEVMFEDGVWMLARMEDLEF